MPTAGLKDGCKAEWTRARRCFLPAISGCPGEISDLEGAAGNGAAEGITVHPVGNIPVSTGRTATLESYCPASTAGDFQQRRVLPPNPRNSNGHQDGTLVCEPVHGRTRRQPTLLDNSSTSHMVEIH